MCFKFNFLDTLVFRVLLFFVIRNKVIFKKPKKSRVNFKLAAAPQRKGLVRNVVFKTPKKPNSALRTIARVVIYKNSRLALCRVIGSGHIPQRYNRVLLRGGRANDVPGVRLTLIRNVYDFAGLLKKKRRSFYGTRRPQGQTFFVRRRYRSFAVGKYI